MAKPDSPIKSATKAGMNALINAAGGAVGIPPGMTKPLIGAVIALLLLAIGSVTIIGYAIAHYFSFLRYFIRDKQNGGPANTLTVQVTDATIYVNLIYPSGSDCTTKYGGELIFKKNGAETACSSVTDAIKNDGDTKIGVKLSGTFYEGAAAASDPAVSTANARFVASSATASGTTYWLYIPGYHNSLSGEPSTGIPVVGTLTNTPTATKGPDGEDLGLRFDLYAKSAAEANSIRSNWLSHDNCKKSQPGYYDCAVTGVTIKFGSQVGAGGPLTEAGGNYSGTSGSLTVSQEFRFPTSLISNVAINPTYGRPNYIILHYLGESGSRPMTAREAYNYFHNTVSNSNPDDNKYVQYIIAQNGTVYQLLAETKKAAGACGFNSTPGGGISISIENEGNFEMGGPGTALGYTSAQLRANIELVTYLMRKWNIPAENVQTHAWAYQNYGRSKGCDARSDPGDQFYNAVKNGL